MRGADDAARLRATEPPVGGSNGGCSGSATRQRGFSLLETLVALSILAICLGTLLRIFGGGGRAALMTDEYARGLIVAESMLASLGTEIEVAPGRKQGVVAGSIRWAVQVSPLPFQMGDQSEINFTTVPVWVEVTAAWGADETRSVRLGTVRLMPAKDASNPINKLPPRRS